MRPSVLPALSLAVVALTTGVASAEAADHRDVFTFADGRVTESSGLVSRGGTMFTVNDSGDGPVVYAVDSSTGDTVGVTTFSADPVSDVEAMAPGRAETVWVGDIGDNNGDRPSVDVYRVPVGRSMGDVTVDADRFRLVYPDGPHDAEALLVHPTSGRLYVVSKGILGGAVYAAPASLDPGTVNPMRLLGHVPDLVTDGAFLPDGRHILLRSYGEAAVYGFPGLGEVGRMELPEQEQGEGLAVDDRGRVFLSTEGAHSAVLEILVPDRIRAALGRDTLAEQPARRPAAESADAAADPSLPTDEDTGFWVAGGAVLVAAAGWLLLTVVRRRSPRRR